MSNRRSYNPYVTKLEDALALLDLAHEPPLAFAHVTLGKWLATIIDSTMLQPRHCEVLGERALYFSYGTPSYRPKSRQTQDALELPIALVFGASLGAQFGRFFPFDTGAMSEGRFGEGWDDLREDFRELHVGVEPERLVSCFYETNERYLGGRVSDAKPGADPELIRNIRSFLTTNLSHLDVDQRQRTIECVALRSVSLLSHLELVVYPDVMAPQVARLWKLASPKFRYISYEYDVSENPAALMSHVSRLVKKELKHLHCGPL